MNFQVSILLVKRQDRNCNEFQMNFSKLAFNYAQLW